MRFPATLPKDASSALLFGKVQGNGREAEEVLQGPIQRALPEGISGVRF